MEYFLMAKGWFRDLLIPMKPTESTPPTTTTSREWVISFRETFFIPLLLFDAMFPTTVPTLKKLVIYVKNRGEPLKRECMSESILSRDDAETPSLAILAHIYVHIGIIHLLFSLPSPRHFITSFDPPLFVLDGLLFSYYCLIGLSLHLSVQILKKIMKPMLNTLAISLKKKGIISVSLKFESGKNREQKPLVDFDSTNNRACQNGLLVSNSDKTNAREASKGPCMTEGVPSLVDSTTRISSTDFDAQDNSAHLVRANQSGPIMLNSEKNDTSEGLIGECLTESVLSLDDSTKRKLFPDFDAAENKAHLVRPYQSGPVVSLSENKNEGEALKKDLQQHCGGRSDAAAKSFRAIYDPGLHTTDSLTWKSFEVLETLRPREQQSNATDTDQERQIQTQMCDELSDARGGRPDAAAKSFHAVYDPGFHTPYSVARKSFEVLETLPARKQPNDGVPLLLPGRLTLEGCVQQEKSPDLARVMQFNGVERRVTKMPRYLGGLTAQSASSLCGPIGLPNGGHIVLLDELDQSTKNIEHVATADQCSPTLSLPEKKMVRKTLNRNCRTMSVIFEEKHQRFVRRCEGATKSLGAMCISRKHGINQVSMVEPIHKQRGIHQWPFLRSAVGLPDGGHILSLLEKKIVRKTLKRKCKSMSVLSLEDHKQHVDRRWEDAAKSHGAKCIRRQLVIHRLSTAKHTHKKHGIHQWPFQRPAISLPDRGHILSISEKKIVRKTLKRKCRSMSVLCLVDRQQHVDRRWEDAAKNIGTKRIGRQLVIHRVSIAKRICRQHGIHHRWPFERDWATEKGYSLGDEIPVEVINLSTHAELVSRLQLIYISWLGRFSPRTSAIPRGGLIAGPIALSSSEFAATNNIAQRVRQDQRGSGASGSEKKRTREQDPKEKPKSITIDDLLPYQGKKTREETAAILHVSRSTVYRTWSKSGRGTWKNGGKNKVWRPPDQHGKGNTSTAREIPSHNVQTGMEGEPVGQNQEENECRRDFMGRQIALDTESGLITVSRPPDQHGERNTSTARETPSHNVQTGIEGVPVGQNQEANEFRPDFTEGSIPSNTENGLIKGSYFGFPPPQITSMPSEYMGGSIDLRNSLANLTFATCSDQAAPSQHVQGQSMHPTVYPDHNVFPQTQIVSSQEPFSEPLGFPPPQITLMPSENKGGSIDLRNSLASQVVSDGHISGSTNSTFATCSDQAALSQHLQGQSMHPTVYPDHNVFPQTQIVSSQEPFSDALGFPPPQITSMPNENMGGSIDLRNSLANLTFATCSDQAAPSQHVQGQSMHPTVYPDHNVFPQTHIVSSKEPFSEGRVMIKAFCRDADNTIIKFWFHLTSGIVDLKKEVSKRLNVEVDRFVVKYKDKYEDLISILCDDDLKLYLSSSLGNDEINVLVHDKVGGTPNFCEKCRSPMQTRA